MSLLVAFSGQGMQHAEMFKILAADDWGNHWLKEAGQLINLDLLDTRVVQRYCMDVIYAQYFIVILEAGAFHAINHQIGLMPECLCGYSLGELTALGVSANLTLHELCSLTKKRASLMLQVMSEAVGKNECRLAVLKGNIDLNLAQLLALSFDCHIAIINAADHFIVGGILTNINALLVEAKSRGVIKAEQLRVSVPSHTPLLCKASVAFFNYLQSAPPGSMKYPILNALTNEVIYNTTDMLPVLANELSHTLHWDRVLQMAPEYGISLFLELGPRNSLKKMFVAENSHIKAYSLDDFSSLSGLAQFIKSSCA
jgi:[acyl-carrier-protein] S-malonyltransferase